MGSNVPMRNFISDSQIGSGLQIMRCMPNRNEYHKVCSPTLDQLPCHFVMRNTDIKGHEFSS